MPVQGYFRDINNVIAEELMHARHTIHVAVAWLTDFDLFNTLLDKIDKGVEVRLIIVNDEINLSSGLDYSLFKHRITLIGNAEELMHHKFCIIDRKTVITGSYNWTFRAQSNLENILVINDNVSLASEFLAEFNTLFNKGTKSFSFTDFMNSRYPNAIKEEGFDMAELMNLIENT